jgi:hypothetical protein
MCLALELVAFANEALPHGLASIDLPIPLRPPIAG